jgi:hypothetical protein
MQIIFKYYCDCHSQVPKGVNIQMLAEPGLNLGSNPGRFPEGISLTKDVELVTQGAVFGPQCQLSL